MAHHPEPHRLCPGNFGGNRVWRQQQRRWWRQRRRHHSGQLRSNSDGNLRLRVIDSVGNTYGQLNQLKPAKTASFPSEMRLFFYSDRSENGLYEGWSFRPWHDFSSPPIYRTEMGSGSLIHFIICSLRIQNREKCRKCQNSWCAFNLLSR